MSQCVWPGCHHESYLALHHVRHWALGGETSAENLLLLCTVHHALVHEGGFSIAKHRDEGYYFVRPDGRPVEVVVPSSDERVESPRAVYRVSPPSAEDDAAQRSVSRGTCYGTRQTWPHALSRALSLVL